MFSIFYVFFRQNSLSVAGVCKDWANIICQPYFLQEYLSRVKTPLQLLLEKGDKILAQLDESALLPSFSKPIKTIVDLNIRRFFSLSASGHLQIDYRATFVKFETR